MDKFEEVGISVREELEKALTEALVSDLREEIKQEVAKLSTEQRIEALSKLIAARPEEQEETEDDEPSEKQPEVKSLASRIMDKLNGKKA